MEIMDPCVPLSLLPPGSKAQVIGKHQAEYLDLPAIRTPLGHVITRWALTDEERTRLLAGEDLYLTIWSHGPINPVCLSVGVCDWTK